MPTAPLLRDQAMLDTDGGRLQQVDTAEAYGAGVGRALSGLGEAGVRVVQHFEERANLADVQEGDAEFQRRSREILFGREADPQNNLDAITGYNNMRGRDALSNRASVEEQLSALRGEISGRRRSRASQEAFDEVTHRRLGSMLTDIDDHAMRETRRVEDAAREALAIESRNSAVANYANEAEAAAHINAGIEVVREQLDADGEEDMAIVERRIRDYQSAAWSMVIKRRVDEDPEGAQMLFEAHKGTMNAEDVAETQASIRGIVLADNARRSARELLTEHGGDFRAAMAAASEIPNTMLSNAVSSELLRVGNEAEMAEDRDADNAEERARAALYAGGTPTGEDAALLMREPGRWERVLASQGRDETSANRTSTRVRGELEALARDNPTQFVALMSAISSGGPTPSERRLAEMEGTVDENDYRVARQMELLRARAQEERYAIEQATGYTAEDVASLRTQLTGDDYRQLRDLQDRMRGMRTVTAAGETLTDEVFNDLVNVATPLAERRGVYLGQAPAGSNEGQLRTIARNRGAIRGALMAAARRHVEQHNRPASPQEMDAIVNRTLARGRREGDWWGERFAFETTGERRVRVRFADIPASDRARYAAAWNAGNPNRPDTPATRQERNAWIEEAFNLSLQQELGTSAGEE